MDDMTEADVERVLAGAQERGWIGSPASDQIRRSYPRAAPLYGYLVRFGYLSSERADELFASLRLPTYQHLTGDQATALRGHLGVKAPPTAPPTFNGPGRAAEAHEAAQSLADEIGTLPGDASQGPRVQLLRLLAQGYRFVRFSYCVSFIAFTYRGETRIHVLPPDGSGSAALACSMLTALLGWWGVPWGPIYTIGALSTNLAGGRDFAVEIIDALSVNALEHGDVWKSRNIAVARMRDG